MTSSKITFSDPLKHIFSDLFLLIVYVNGTFYISVCYLGVYYVCDDKTDNTFLALMKFGNYLDAILASVEVQLSPKC